MIVDAGSVLDERTMLALESADTVVILVYPEIPALKSVHSLLDFLNEAGTLGSKTVSVLNNAFAREILKPRDIEHALGTKIAFDLPYDPFLYLKAVNEGVPIVLGAADSAGGSAARQAGRPCLRPGRISRSHLPSPNAAARSGACAAAPDRPKAPSNALCPNLQIAVRLVGRKRMIHAEARIRTLTSAGWRTRGCWAIHPRNAAANETFEGRVLTPRKLSASRARPGSVRTPSAAPAADRRSGRKVG